MLTLGAACAFMESRQGTACLESRAAGTLSRRQRLTPGPFCSPGQLNRLHLGIPWRACAPPIFGMGSSRRQVPGCCPARLCRGPCS